MSPRVYIDANIIVHYLVGRSDVKRLFDDIKNGKIEGYTSNYSLIETIGFFKSPDGGRKKKEHIVPIIEKIKRIPNFGVIQLTDIMIKQAETRIYDVDVEPKDIFHLVAAETAEMSAIFTEDGMFWENAKKVIKTYSCCGHPKKCPGPEYKKFLKDFNLS